MAKPKKETSETWEFHVTRTDGPGTSPIRISGEPAGRSITEADATRAARRYIAGDKNLRDIEFCKPVAP